MWPSYATHWSQHCYETIRVCLQPLHMDSPWPFIALRALFHPIDPEGCTHLILCDETLPSNILRRNLQIKQLQINHTFLFAETCYHKQFFLRCSIVKPVYRNLLTVSRSHGSRVFMKHTKRYCMSSPFSMTPGRNNRVKLCLNNEVNAFSAPR